MQHIFWKTQWKYGPCIEPSDRCLNIKAPEKLGESLLKSVSGFSNSSVCHLPTRGHLLKDLFFTGHTWHRKGGERDNIDLLARKTAAHWHPWSCFPFPEISPCCRAQGSLQKSSNKDILAPFPSSRTSGQIHTVTPIIHRDTLLKGGRLYSVCTLALRVHTCRK